MKGFNDSATFCLSTCVTTLFELGRGRVKNIEHHVTNFAVRPDDESRRGIAAKRPLGGASGIFGLASSVV